MGNYLLVKKESSATTNKKHIKSHANFQKLKIFNAIIFLYNFENKINHYGKRIKARNFGVLAVAR